ncbi:MAG: NAD(P)/FAD-dependent oxidoreductase [Lachnospiraceae bacterium]|nr:NAD(P)/FAD-dependent oxidoreductase [Lachnospiraceae bacterium]
MDRLHSIIVGSGPGGISAAITLKLRGKNIMLIGNKDGGKLSKAHEIQNYPGFPNVSGKDLNSAFQKHLEEMGIDIKEGRVSAIYAMGDYYSVQVDTEMYEADTVILATGVIAGKPLKGEEELLGRGVSYCATCDAPLYRQKEVVVIGYSQKEEEEAKYLAEVASKVIYIPVYKGEFDFPENVEVVSEKPVEIALKDEKRVVITDQSEIVTDGVFVLRDSISPGQLVPGIEIDGAHVKVDRQMKTSLPGCFACGDITGTPYQYVKAAGEGNVAALSAVSFLASKK